MRRIFKTSGETIDLKGPLSSRDAEKIFDSKSLMFVELLDDEHMMILRDEQSRAGYAVNQIATIICDLPSMPRMQHPIRGDVMIVPTRDVAPHVDVI
jgi:hypothetical protein